MRVNSPLAALVLAALAGPAGAAPRVVADIPPVHSLVARVMAGVGAPELLTPPGASPHGHALRPSEAERLEAAELVFWIGEALTPQYEPAIEALAADAVAIELMAAEGVRALPFREGARFDAHDHGAHDEEHHAEHEDHAAEAAAQPGDAAAREDHDHDHDHDAAADAHDHDHAGADPHVWLDPENARAMLSAISAALSAADPANAAAYAANAEAGRAELAALIPEIEAALAPARGRPFVVFHDAYHHFEARFGVEAAGAISLSDAAAPGPQRLEALRGLVREADVACIFAEPQFDPKLAALVAEGTKARVATLDPLGAGLTPGPDLYPALLRDIAAGLAACLGRAS